MTTKDILMAILDMIILDKYDERYIKYVKKTIDYNIEYLEPIDIIVLPKDIYVLIGNDIDWDTVTKFCSDLVVSISSTYSNRDISIKKYTHMGVTKDTNITKIDSIRFNLGIGSYATIVIDIASHPSITISLVDGLKRESISDECIFIKLINM